MLKITQAAVTSSSVTLKLEGRMVGPWVGEAHTACEKLLDEGRLVALHLAGVSFVDQDGIKFLRNLLSRGVTLVGCSLFVDEQMKPKADV